jgi:hypothetical protein
MARLKSAIALLNSPLEPRIAPRLTKAGTDFGSSLTEISVCFIWLRFCVPDYATIEVRLDVAGIDGNGIVEIGEGRVYISFSNVRNTTIVMSGSQQGV